MIPRIVARLVIRIGLNRDAAAYLMASIFDIPLNFLWLANSTIRIPFLVTSPISIMIPIWLKIFIVTLKYHINKRAPVKANGTVIITIKGSLKLSNWAARTRKIRIIANINANIRLDELSLKSFESPASAVLNVSSSTSFDILSISSSPSLIVFPFAKPAEIVADTNLLYLFSWGGAVSSVRVTRLSNWIISSLLFLTYNDLRSSGL